MSQAKVDFYKEQKANRKEIMKKAKRKSFIAKCIAGVIGLVACVWVGGSVVVKVKDTYFPEDNTRPSVTVNYTAMDDYMQSLSAE